MTLKVKTLKLTRKNEFRRIFLPLFSSWILILPSETVCIIVYVTLHFFTLKNGRSTRAGKRTPQGNISM
jgi:hypothetical protein